MTSPTPSLDLEAITHKLARARVIKLCLEALLRLGCRQLNYLEIGTAFRENEGLSTVIPLFFSREHNIPVVVHSIDNDIVHIDENKRIVSALIPELKDSVSYYHGDSKIKTPEALGEIDSLDFALIDGTGDAVVNMADFELLLSKVSENGIILVDDLVFLPKTRYRARRDFGKCQIIFPVLLIADTLNYYRSRAQNLPESMKELLFSPSFGALVSFLEAFSFVRYGNMLAIMRTHVLEKGLLLDPDDNLNFPWPEASKP